MAADHLTPGLSWMLPLSPLLHAHFHRMIIHSSATQIILPSRCSIAFQWECLLNSSKPVPAVWKSFGTISPLDNLPFHDTARFWNSRRVVCCHLMGVSRHRRNLARPWLKTYYSKQPSALSDLERMYSCSHRMTISTSILSAYAECKLHLRGKSEESPARTKSTITAATSITL